MRQAEVTATTPASLRFEGDAIAALPDCRQVESISAAALPVILRFGAAPTSVYQQVEVDALTPVLVSQQVEVDTNAPASTCPVLPTTTSSPVHLCRYHCHNLQLHSQLTARFGESWSRTATVHVAPVSAPHWVKDETAPVPVQLWDNSNTTTEKTEPLFTD